MGGTGGTNRSVSVSCGVRLTAGGQTLGRFTSGVALRVGNGVRITNTDAREHSTGNVIVERVGVAVRPAADGGGTVRLSIPSGYFNLSGKYDWLTEANSF